MEHGQQVMLWLQIANRDRSVFPFADAFVADRTPNRHLGNGIHRCVGAHLLRVECTVALTEFLKRIPEFELDRGKKTQWSPGQISGFSAVPIVFPAGEQPSGPNSETTSKRLGHRAVRQRVAMNSGRRARSVLAGPLACARRPLVGPLRLG